MLILSRYTQNTKVLITWGTPNSLQNLLVFYINTVVFNRHESLDDVNKTYHVMISLTSRGQHL